MWQPGRLYYSFVLSISKKKVPRFKTHSLLLRRRRNRLFNYFFIHSIHSACSYLMFTLSVLSTVIYSPQIEEDRISVVS